MLSSGDEGKQAFSELQGALLRDIQEQATKGVAPDANGQPMVSPAALNTAINKVDDKLDAILGKQSADKLRLLNDVSKDLLTLPASAAVNHSNTASGYRDWETDRKSTRLNSSHRSLSRMPSSA